MAARMAVLDACVLYPAPLRDFLVHLAITDAFLARWTEAIHDEWIRNLLLQRPDLKPEQLHRTRMLMNSHVRDCVVAGYEPLLDSLVLPDPDDRHVLAAAIHCQADAILTLNLKDFPAAVLSPFGIVAMPPDRFVQQIFAVAPDAVFLAAQRQRLQLKNPPKTVVELLDTLQSVGMTETVNLLRPFADRL